MRTRNKTERSSFKCSKLGGAAKIERSYNLLPNGARLPSGVECKSCLECGIASHEGEEVTFDWSACVHPELRRSASA